MRVVTFSLTFYLPPKVYGETTQWDGRGTFGVPGTPHDISLVAPLSLRPGRGLPRPRVLVKSCLCRRDLGDS